MNSNPYQATTSIPNVAESPGQVRAVSINPFDLYQRSFRLLGDQYWLFLGITIVAMLIGGLVPLALLMGAMMIGVSICLLQREQGQRVEFGTVFKGFDQIGDSIVAMLILVGLVMLMLIPLLVVMVAMIFGVLAVMPKGQAEGIALFMAILFYLGLIFGSMFMYAPFLFVFPLMAERKMAPWSAVKLSFNGMKRNLWGILLFILVNGVISMILAVMCYLPLFFFMPIAFAANHLLYRDIYSP